MTFYCFEPYIVTCSSFINLLLHWSIYSWLSRCITARGSTTPLVTVGPTKPYSLYHTYIFYPFVFIYSVVWFWSSDPVSSTLVNFYSFWLVGAYRTLKGWELLVFWDDKHKFSKSFHSLLLYVDMFALLYLINFCDKNLGPGQVES